MSTLDEKILNRIERNKREQATKSAELSEKAKLRWVERKAENERRIANGEDPLPMGRKPGSGAKSQTVNVNALFKNVLDNAFEASFDYSEAHGTEVPFVKR